MSNRLTEIGDKQIISKLATMSYTAFLNVIKQSEWKYEAEDESFAENYREQYTLIKKYCIAMKKNNYSMNVDYAQSPKQPTGRVYSSKGIQPLWGMFRGAICCDKYYDFDMVCAHNSILLYICKKHKIESYYLSQYVERRDAVLKEFSDSDGIKRKEGKQMFISSLYDENKRMKLSDKKTKIKFDFYLRYDEEIKRIQQELPRHYPAVWKTLKRKNFSDDNLYGKLVSNICCELENKILQDVIQMTTPNVLMFDGFMVDTERIECPEAFVKKLNARTKSYKIKWSEKEMDCSIYDAILYMDTDGASLSIVADTLAELATELHSTLLVDRIYKCKDLYYFKTDNKWVSGNGFSVKDIIYKELFQMIFKQLDLYVYDCDKMDSVEVVSSIKLVSDLIQIIYYTAPTDNDFIERIWDWTKNKIYFKNGYWDFTKETFNENDGNTFNMVEYEFKNETNPDVRKELFDRVLNPIFTCYDDVEDYETRCQLRDYFLYFIARAGGGAVSDKVWGVLTGERNCGKSALIDLICNCFGSYAGVSAGKQLLYQANMGDPAKELSWVIPYQFKRFLMTSEIPSTPDRKKLVFDGNKIKMITSGGDKIEVRKNYCDEQQIKIQATLLCAFNDEPECCPTDALATSKCFGFVSKFIDPESKERQFHNIKYIKKETWVKDVYIKKPEVINEFFIILTELFNNLKTYPSILQNERDEDNLTDTDILLNHFVFTNNEADFVTNDLISEVLKKINSPFKLKKSKDYLKGLTKKKIEKVIKVNGKVQRGLCCIQYRETISELG